MTKPQDVTALAPNSFTVREIGELENRDEQYYGVILEGDIEAVRSVSQFFGEKVSIVSAAPVPERVGEAEQIASWLESYPHDMSEEGDFDQEADGLLRAASDLRSLSDRLKEAEWRFSGLVDYSVDLQRIIEDLCNDRAIREPQTAARQHYNMACARAESALARSSVKPLEWSANKGNYCFTARCSVGTYEIEDQGKSQSHNRYWLRINYHLTKPTFGTLEAAKAAAQADYDQRILAALSPAARSSVVTWSPTKAEIKSRLDRVRWAEGLIEQLPAAHNGRNSWLLNYGTKEEAQEKRAKRGLSFDPITQAAALASADHHENEG